MEAGKWRVDVGGVAIGRHEPLGCGFVMVQFLGRFERQDNSLGSVHHGCLGVVAKSPSLPGGREGGGPRQSYAKRPRVYIGSASVTSQGPRPRIISAASARFTGRLSRIASRSRSPTAARAAAQPRSMPSTRHSPTPPPPPPLPPTHHPTPPPHT